MHLLFASKLQHVMSHYTSNKGSVTNKLISLINIHQQKLFSIYISRIYNQGAGDTKSSCFLKLKKQGCI